MSFQRNSLNPGTLTSGAPFGCSAVQTGNRSVSPVIGFGPTSDAFPSLQQWIYYKAALSDVLQDSFLLKRDKFQQCSLEKQSDVLLRPWVWWWSCYLLHSAEYRSYVRLSGCRVISLYLADFWCSPASNPRQCWLSMLVSMRLMIRLAYLTSTKLSLSRLCVLVPLAQALQP
jgi:hypothetical protein